MLPTSIKKLNEAYLKDIENYDNNRQVRKATAPTLTEMSHEKISQKNEFVR